MSTQAPPTIELWLLGWSTRHNTGNKIEFAISDEDLELFKSATTRSKGHAGQRYAMVCVQLDDDERPKDQRDNQPAKEPATATLDMAGLTGVAQKSEPAKQPAKHAFPNGLCGLAVKWCESAEFQEWVSETYPELWTAHQDKPAERAKLVIYEICGIASRTQLDTLHSGRDKFEKMFRLPYMAFLQEDDDGREA